MQVVNEEPCRAPAGRQVAEHLRVGVGRSHLAFLDRALHRTHLAGGGGLGAYMRGLTGTHMYIEHNLCTQLEQKDLSDGVREKSMPANSQQEVWHFEAFL